MKKQLLLILVLLISIFMIGLLSCSDPGDDEPADDSIPPAVLKLTRIVIAQNQVTISWTASTDSDFNHTKISCSNGSSVNIFGTQTCAIPGLSSDTEYMFTLNTVDNADNLSEDVNFTVSTTTGVVISGIPIFTADDLNSVRDDLVENYLLVADIDLTSYSAGSGWVPIGDFTNRFTGTFYGSGYVIRNLFINRPGSDYQGLFGFISNGTIKDLGVEDVDVTGNEASGGLVGISGFGTISNCYATGSVNGNVYTGGLVGYSDGTISDCYATGTVGGIDCTGGLVGQNVGGTAVISNCYATGVVNGGTFNTGGLVGRNVNGTISDCYATGTVSGTNNYTGGLVGLNNAGFISDCYATGTVSGAANTGGLVGRNFNNSGVAVISGCYATGTVSGTDYTGSLVGQNNKAISDCYATGAVNGGGNYTGGLVGGNSGIISGCYAIGTVNGASFAGGLVGSNAGTILYCHYDTETTGQSDTGKGEPRTTAQMKLQGTFTGWDFTTIWGIAGSINDGYPYLIDNQP